MVAERILREHWGHRGASRSPDLALRIPRRHAEPAVRPAFEPWECPACGEMIGYVGRGLFWATGWHKNMENCASVPTQAQTVAALVLRWLALGGFFALCLWAMWRVFVAMVAGT